MRARGRTSCIPKYSSGAEREREECVSWQRYQRGMKEKEDSEEGEQRQREKRGEAVLVEMLLEKMPKQCVNGPEWCASDTHCFHFELQERNQQKNLGGRKRSC